MTPLEPSTNAALHDSQEFGTIPSIEVHDRDAETPGSPSLEEQMGLASSHRRKKRDRTETALKKDEGTGAASKFLVLARIGLYP